MRAVVPALVAAYALFVGMVLHARRGPTPRRRDIGEEQLHRRDLIKTILGGYTVFLTIVVVFHVWLADERGVLIEALLGGAFLASVAVGAAFVSGAMSRRRAGT